MLYARFVTQIFAFSGRFCLKNATKYTFSDLQYIDILVIQVEKEKI